MMARQLALSLLLIAPFSRLRGDDVVRWNEGAAYARSEDSNGQHYKSIQLKDRIYVWASFRHDRASTLANVIVINEGKERVDLDPRRFTCLCGAGKPKTLKYEWPFGTPMGPNAMVLRVTTLLQSENVKGVVSFQRIKKCDRAVVRVPIEGTTFEFPFP
jgi:hypothetical protein